MATMSSEAMSSEAMSSEAMSSYESRFNKLDNDLTAVRGDINLLTWMNGITWAFSLGILFKLFR